MALKVTVVSVLSYIVHVDNLPSEKYLKFLLVYLFWISRYLVLIKKYYPVSKFQSWESITHTVCNLRLVNAETTTKYYLRQYIQCAE